jgi:hypothetical protein
MKKNFPALIMFSQMLTTVFWILHKITCVYRQFCILDTVLRIDMEMLYYFENKKTILR